MSTLQDQRRRTKTAGDTGEEALYLHQLSEKQTCVNVKMKGGEVFEGWIEYFDDNMLRLTRHAMPNLFLYKNQILTIFESDRRQSKKPNTMGEERPMPRRSSGQKRGQA
jgi:host factor-I protein